MKTFNQFIKESLKKRTSMKEFQNLFHKFIPYVLKELKLKSIPPIHFKNGKDGLHVKNVPGVTVIDNSEFSMKTGTFGETSHKNRIVVNIKNRHPLDALRTVAHELSHYHQHTIGTYGTGKTGSSTENEASAKASIIMRNFDHAYPDLFKLEPLE